METDTINSCGKIKNSNGVKTIKKIATVVLIIVLILTAVLTLPFGVNNKNNIAKADEEVLITVTHSAVAGGAFTVDINIDPNGKNIAGMQFDFEFDPAVAQADSIVWNSLVVDESFSFSGTINNSTGIIEGIWAMPLDTEGDLFDCTDNAIGDCSFGLTPFTIATIQMSGYTAGTSTLALPYTTYDAPPLIVSQSGDSAALPYIVYNSMISDDVIAPTITSVTTTHADGSFKEGEIIDITVAYDEAVDVVTTGGTPTLALNSSGSAVYNSGTGTDTLTFRYTVGAGETSTDLDYSATNSLALNGGTIKDVVLNIANNTLPAVGTFAAAHAIVIDTTVPTITSIVSDATGVGVLKIGDAIIFTLTPGATETGGSVSGSYNDVALTWSTADSGATYTAAYAVVAGNTDRTSALQISGVILTDAAGNSSVAATGTDIVKTIDATAPTNQDTVFASSISKQGGASVTIASSGDAANNVWFAPSGTTTFTAGTTMTKAASGTAIFILAPATDGAYKLFVIDAAGNYSTASTATLTVIIASSAKTITSFNFASPSVTGTINNTAFTVALTVPYGTGVTALAPTIIVSTNAVINPASGAVQNFTSPVTYTVRAEDASTQAYTVTVTVAAAPSSGGGGGGGGGTPTSAVTNMSISINNGAATANSPTVTLTIGATNATKMVISNSADFSGAVWETYATSKSWTLTSGDGTKTVYIKFQDASGYSSTTISDSITLGAATTVAYPDGTILKSSTAPEVYVIKNGEKEWIKTAEEFIAGGYKWENLKIISPEALAAIPVYGSGGGSNPNPIPAGGFSDGALIKISDSFRVYVIIGQKKKWIPTPEVFETLGYKWTNITVISKADLDKIPDYEDNLIRTIGDYKVYLVVSGIRRHIPNPEIFLDYGFLWEDVKDVPAETVNKYSRGYLIRESRQGTIYYLSSSGVKKWIPNPEIFASYNNKWEDIQVISKKEMESYPESNIMRYAGKLYLISGTYKKLIPSDVIFTKNKYDTGLILDANKTEFDWYKTGAAIK